MCQLWKTAFLCFLGVTKKGALKGNFGTITYNAPLILYSTAYFMLSGPKSIWTLTVGLYIHNMVGLKFPNTFEATCM